MSERRAIVFDLDGTLLDLNVPIESVRADIRRFFADRGEDREMRPILSAIRSAAQAVSNDPDPLIREALSILDRAEAKCAELAPLRTGIAECAALAGPFALLTNNSRPCAAVAIERLRREGLAFEASVTRDDVAAAKPDPEGMLLLWTLLGSPSELVLVGDSVLDCAAGSAFRSAQPECAMTIVGVLGGRSSAAELKSAGADWLAADLREFATRV